MDNVSRVVYWTEQEDGHWFGVARYEREGTPVWTHEVGPFVLERRAEDAVKRWARRHIINQLTPITRAKPHERINA